MINTNTPFHDAEDPQLMPFCDTFAKVLSALFEDKEELSSVLNFNTRAKVKEIHSAVSNTVIERGEEKHCPHAHITLQIQHQSNILLSYPKMKDWLQREMRRKCKEEGLPVPKGINVKPKFLPEFTQQLATEEALIHYMEKNIDDYEQELHKENGDQQEVEQEKPRIVAEEQQEEEEPKTPSPVRKEPNYDSDIADEVPEHIYKKKFSAPVVQRAAAEVQPKPKPKQNVKRKLSYEHPGKSKPKGGVIHMNMPKYKKHAVKSRDEEMREDSD